jgi:hypothetical protein
MLKLVHPQNQNHSPNLCAPQRQVAKVMLGSSMLEPLPGKQLKPEGQG